jgi:DNA-binding transcriptional ArsR family regulator
MASAATTTDGGRTRTGLRGRTSLSDADAADLTRLFKALTNPGRVQILHTLALADELSVGDLAEAAGMSAQATSNQLVRLVDQGFLASTRDGARVLYRIADPCIPELLDLGLCLIDEAAKQSGTR